MKKVFQRMYKNFNKENETTYTGTFKEKEATALIKIGEYRTENGEVKNSFGKDGELDEKEKVEKLDIERLAFMRSEQFIEFIRETGAYYKIEDNVKWNVGNGVVIYSKHIRFRMK